MSVDNRVVVMTFDNAQFEKGVDQSVNSLEKLNDACDMGEMQKAFNNFSVASISDGVDSLSDRFSNMGIIGMTVLENLTNRVTDMAVSFAKSMTTDQISAGFSKYEDSTKDIIALMNQADMTMGDAQRYIDTLSWYSDATSFGFTDMTSALKTFVANGQDIDQSIATIMGIGNSITYAGKSAAVGAEVFDMYAKVMGTGYMNQMRWNQLALRGVASEKLKNDMLEAAAAVGTLTKTLDKNGEATYRVASSIDKSRTVVNSENFASTLAKKWLTADVVRETYGGMYGSFAANLQQYIESSDELMSTVEAVDKYVAEQFDSFSEETMMKNLNRSVSTLQKNSSAGWTSKMTAEYKFIKDQFSEVTKDGAKFTHEVYEEGLKSFVKFLQDEGKFESRTKAIQLYNEALGISFDQLGLEMLNSASEARTFAEAVDAVKDAASTQFRSIFEMVFGNADEARVLWSEFSDYINNLFVTPIAAFAEILKEWKSFGGRDAMIQTFKNLANGVESYIRPISLAFSEVFGISGKSLADFTKKLAESTSKFQLNAVVSAKLHIIFTNLFKAIKKIVTITSKVITVGIKVINAVLKPILKFVSELIFEVTTIITWIADKMEKTFGHTFFKIGQFVTDGFNNGFLSGVSRILETVGNFVISVIKKVKELFGIASPSKEFYEIAKWCVEGFINGFKTFMKKVPEVLKGVTDAIKEAVANGSLEEIKNAIEEIIDTLAGLLEIAIVYRLFKIFQNLTGFSKLAKVPMNALTGALKSVRTAMTQVKKTFQFATLTQIALAIGIFVLTLKTLASMNDQETVEGILYLGIMLFMLQRFIKGLNGLEVTDNIVTSMSKLTKVTTALTILAAATWILSKIEPGRLLKSVIAMGMLIGALVGSIAVLGLVKDGIKPSAIASMLAVVLAVNLLIPAIAAMSLLIIAIPNGAAFEVIAGSIIAIFMCLFAIIGAVRLMSSSMSLKQIPGVLIGALVALALVGGIVAALAAMEGLEDSLKNAAAIALIIAAVSVGLALLNKLLAHGDFGSKGNFASSLISIAGAFAIFAGALWVLSLVPIKQLGLELLILAGAITLVIGAFVALGYLGPVVDKGVIIFNKISGAMAKFVAIIMALPVGIALFIGALSLVGAGTAKALQLLLKIIADAAPDIALAVHAIVVSMIEMLVNDFPLIVAAVLVLINDLLITLQAAWELISIFIMDGTDEIVEWLVVWIIKLALALAKSVYDHRDALMIAISNILNTLGNIIVSLLLRGIGKIASLTLNLLDGLFKTDIAKKFDAFWTGDEIQKYADTLFTIDTRDPDEILGRPIEEAGKSATNALSKVKDRVTTEGKGIMSTIGDIFKGDGNIDVIDKISDSMSSRYAGMAESAGIVINANDDISKSAEDTVKNVDQSGNQIGNVVSSGLENIVGNIQNGLGGMSNSIKNFTTDTSKYLDDPNNKLVFHIGADTTEIDTALNNLRNKDFGADINFGNGAAITMPTSSSGNTSYTVNQNITSPTPISVTDQYRMQQNAGTVLSLGGLGAFKAIGAAGAR